MMRDWFEWLRGLKHRGFIGPKYHGLVGKARLQMQGWFGHIEIVSYAEREWWERPAVPNPAVELVVASSFEEVAPFLVEMKEAYSRSFAKEWKTYFEWGQVATLVFLEGRLAGFGWIQDGSKGASAPYLPLFPGEFRSLRAGVLPSFRGKHVHTTRHVLLLDYLFSKGARRVYVDAFEDNEYSWRGAHKAGYREIGKIHVKTTLRGRTYVRWITRSSPGKGKE